MKMTYEPKKIDPGSQLRVLLTVNILQECFLLSAKYDMHWNYFEEYIPKCTLNLSLTP